MKVTDKSPDDPDCMGFRQLASELFASSGAHAISDLSSIGSSPKPLQCRSRFEDLPLTPAPTFAGATEAIGGVALAGIDGASDRYTAAQLSDLRANIEGVRKIVDLFQPLIAKADERLDRALAQEFAALNATLAAYQNADAVFERGVSLSSDDRTRLQNVMKKLAGELALIPAALGIG